MLAFPSTLVTATSTRLEEITPPGRVPLPTATVRPVSDVREQGYIETKAELAPKPRFETARMGANKFASAYIRAKSPRIAIYFNRSLSDQVTEWASTRRAVDQIQYEGRAKNPLSVDGKKILSGTSETKGMVTRTREEQEAVGSMGMRDDPAERWAWEFEDAIVNRFLDQNVNVVDRALMFRLMANKSAPFSTISNETSALQNYADVLIEVLVTNSGRSLIGYDFRATAKSIKQQTILASTFFDGTNNTNIVTERYTANQDGYRKVKEQAPLQIDDVAEQLSQKLMSALAKRWDRN